MAMERTPNKSQYTKLTLDKKILPPLLPEFELATIRSRVRRSYQQAMPASTSYSETKRQNEMFALQMKANAVSVSNLVWKLVRETSSQAARQGLTLGHSRLSSLSHCGLILA